MLILIKLEQTILKVAKKWEPRWWLRWYVRVSEGLTKTPKKLKIDKIKECAAYFTGLRGCGCGYE